jgi:hypothetical protein
MAKEPLGRPLDDEEPPLPDGWPEPVVKMPPVRLPVGDPVIKPVEAWLDLPAERALTEARLAPKPAESLNGFLQRSLLLSLDDPFLTERLSAFRIACARAAIKTLFWILELVRR